MSFCHLTRLNVQTVYLHFIECKDNNNFCGTWAARGECEHTPGYMLRNCKESCLQCGKLLLQYSQRQDIHNKVLNLIGFQFQFCLVISCILAELKNTEKDCWYECNRKQGLCSWCGTKGMCCKKGFSDTSNGCDGTFGGSARHECVLKSAGKCPI